MQFQLALKNLDIGPTVGALKDKLRHIAHEEFERQRPRLGDITPEQERAIEAMLQAIVNKISHPVIQPSAPLIRHRRGRKHAGVARHFRT